MKTVKKLWMYFFMFIGFFVFCTFLTNITMREQYNDITNYEIKDTSPQISVKECKAIYTSGYMNGSVTNDTGDLIPLKYLKVNFYDADGIYLGSEYKELKNFYPDETINFDINYNYNNVNKVELSLTDNMTNNNKDSWIINPDISEETINIALPIAGVILLWYILPY